MQTRAPSFKQKRLAQAMTCALLAMSASSAFAVVPYTSSNRDILSPNSGTWDANGVTLGGLQFKNLGLQGVGRVAASTIDSATGESLGSISDMQITGFTNNGNGTWSGVFNFLPDRGFNSGATFSNYAARINTFDFTFTPYTANVPTTLQNQIAMTFTGSTRFTYDHDGSAGTAPIFTTGLLPTSSAQTLFGTKVPTVVANSTQSDGTFANRLTVDAEGLILDTRAGKAGSGWFGDEYGAYIYHFNSQKVIDGQLLLPDALVPHTGTAIDFVVGQATGSGTPTNGRRINQGMEGIALSPDGTKLFGLLQSATNQDSNNTDQASRSNTRLVVYDVSGSDTPSDPTSQYVIQLPRLDDNGGTVALNRTAAQSSIIALNDHQVLILSRDGNGRGANNSSAVFKSVLLADLSNATNIDGSFDSIGSVVTDSNKELLPSITPIAWTEALNMLGKLDLNVTEIEQFGLNLQVNNGDINTLSEKWEGLGLAPVGDGTGDYFLFIGNDNDFQSATGKLLDQSGNVVSYNAGLENDTVVLAYRVSIAPVPLPPAMWLMGSGVVGLLGWARRRV